MATDRSPQVTSDDLDDPHTFCNCGKAGCPTIRSENGGVVVDAPETELVAGVDGRTGVPFTADQARQLRVWLQQHGF